jgi:hypothetical protein
MSLVYVAIAPCGCIAGADFEDSAETHAQIVEWVQRGFVVERRDDTDGIRFGCPHEPKWGRAA